MVLYGKSDTPFELIIERLCQRYHKLPSEVLDEDMEWIRILLEVMEADIRRGSLEEKRSKLKDMGNGRQ